MGRHRRSSLCHGVAVLLTVLPAVVTEAPVFAGEQLSPDQLLDRARAVAEVQVHFKGHDGVELRRLRWLRGGRNGGQVVAWNNRCLPTRKLLRQWSREHGNWPLAARRLWARLARQPGYGAILFLGNRRNDPGVLEPICGLEVLDLSNVDLHPEYTKWRRRLLASIAEDRAR